MQYRPITVSVPVRTGEWIRTRQNWRLWAVVNAPLDELRNGPHDPWSRVKDERGIWHPVYTPDATWLAAVDEYNRRIDLYYRLVPVTKWGVS